VILLYNDTAVCLTVLPVACPFVVLQAKCPGQGTQCIWESGMCNGQSECADGSDEDPVFCATYNCSSAGIANPMVRPQDTVHCVTVSLCHCVTAPVLASLNPMVHPQATGTVKYSNE